MKKKLMQNIVIKLRTKVKLKEKIFGVLDRKPNAK